MILNLSLYQAALPYPVIQNIEPDEKLVKKLQEGYSGGISELTTVLQYAQHSLLCEHDNREISQIMRGIFYVETIHMELLGKCLCKLHHNGSYNVLIQNKDVPWQSSFVSYHKDISRMIEEDIAGEQGAVAFYEEIAAATEQWEVKNLMLRLAEDERLHIKILKNLYSKYFS